jgi:hypothetical protein
MAPALLRISVVPRQSTHTPLTRNVAESLAGVPYLKRHFGRAVRWVCNATWAIDNRDTGKDERCRGHDSGE